MSTLDGSPKTLEQLLADLTEAGGRLIAAKDQEGRDLEAAAEMEEKAANRVKDAINVYNGIARDIDQALQKVHASAPIGTIWNEAPKGGTP